MTLMKTNQENNYLILNENEQETILNMFPEKLQPYIKSCNNPLDETQVLVNLFKDKNVRIVLKEETDEFGYKEWISYYNCVDLAKEIKYSTSHINQWKERWDVNTISYEKMLTQNELAKICEINKRRTDKNAYYINEQDLKKGFN